MSDVDVLYIMGTGRSGSTLLANLLGSTAGLFSAGELRFIWDRGFLEDRHCGCSQTFHTCPLWTSVIERTFGDDEPDAARMIRESRQVTRVRQLPKVLLGSQDADALHEAAGYYLENVERLYQGLAGETGSIIVDSSKLPTYCHLLSRIPSVRLRIVHLVRDPRATAHSWLRLRATGAVDDDDEEMDQFSVWKSSALWDIWNTTARHLFGSSSDYLCVRYEDLMARPSDTIDKVRAFAGLPADDELFVGERTVRLLPNHAVAGNPNRRRSGDTQLVRDDEWRTALSRRDRLTVTAITAPMLGRFGYPLSGSGPA